jgi:hypothetical protein
VGPVMSGSAHRAPLGHAARILYPDSGNILGWRIAGRDAGVFMTSDFKGLKEDVLAAENAGLRELLRLASTRRGCWLRRASTPQKVRPPENCSIYCWKNCIIA